MIDHLSPERLAAIILQAKTRLLYAAPGAAMEIAGALVTKFRDLGQPYCTLILDVDPEVCRLGYGAPEALEVLREAAVPIRQESGLRTGILIVDGHGWMFSPIPLLIESPAVARERPNAMQLSADQIDLVIRAFGIASDPTKLEKRPEIGTALADAALLDATKKSLEERPPLKFDLERQVRVFHSIIQFVEAEVQGGRMASRRVKLPSSLLVGVNEKDVQKRLRVSLMRCFPILISRSSSPMRTPGSI